MKKRFVFFFVLMITLSKVGMGQTAVITIVGSNTYTYNAAPQFNLISTNVNITGSIFQTSATVYTYTGTDFNGVPYNSTVNPPTNAGTYQLVASANFTVVGLVNSNIISFTINPKLINVIADVNTKVFGQVDPVLTYTNDPLFGSDVFSSALTRAAGEGVNTYTIELGTLALSSNYSISYTSANFTITPKPITITANSGQTKEYGAVDPILTYTPSTTLVSGDSYSGSLSRAVGEGVNSYAINIGTLSLGGNYSVTYVTSNFTITPKPITITANSGQAKEYGAVDPILTYTPSTTLVSGDSYSGSLARVAGEGVNSYAINIGTLSLGGNYSVTYVTSNFIIKPKPITITANSGQAKEYGAVDPILTYTPSTTLVSGDSYSGSLVRAVGEGVNSYAINIGTLSLGGNYSITYVTSNFTITPAPLTIKNITGANKIYDGTTAASVNGTAAYDGLVAADAGLATVQGGPSFNFDNKDAGVNKPITVTGFTAPSSNYVLTQPTGLTASITPAPITIAGITGVSRVYDGTTNATVTGSPVYTGLVAGESLTVVGSPIYSFANKNVGTAKPITVTGFTAPNGNYILSSQPTGITANITPKLLTITAASYEKVYDANRNVPGLNLSIDRIEGDDVSISRNPLFENANAGVNKDIILTGVTINPGLDAANYYLASTTAIVKGAIKPLQINIVAIDATKTELDPDPPFTYQPVSLLGTDVFTGSLSRFPGEAPADYPITIGSLSAGNNYLLNLNSAKLTIKPLVTNYIFEVPNAFTPNLDGTNDVLKIIKNYRVTGLNYFRIYNRTGQLVFETRTLTEGWNGRRMGDMSGNILESDLYIWVAEFTNMNDVGPVKKSGTVLLLK